MHYVNQNQPNSKFIIKKRDKYATNEIKIVKNGIKPTLYV